MCEGRLDGTWFQKEYRGTKKAPSRLILQVLQKVICARSM
jgi:hypothetical protein